MSLIKKKIILPCLSVLALTALGFYFSLGSFSIDRTPSHIKPQLKFSKKAFHHTQKLTNAFKIKIEKIDSDSIKINSIFTLKATLSSDKYMEQPNIQWHLPESVSIVTGDSQPSLTELIAHEVYEFEISLKSQSEANQQIHFTVGASRGGIRMSESSMYNTILEEEIRESKKALVKRTKTYQK